MLSPNPGIHRLLGNQSFAQSQYVRHSFQVVSHGRQADVGLGALDPGQQETRFDIVHAIESSNLQLQSAIGQLILECGQ